MLDYAVIGTSWITRSFIDGAKLDGRLNLAGVMSRSYEKGLAFARENSCDTVFTSLEELCASSIPAVYVASPNALHPVQTKALLEAGKHVICEKPITVTPSELVYLQRLAKEKGVIYVEAIMYMYNPARELLKKALGEIGVISSVNLDFSQLSSKYAAYKNGGLPNIFNPALATGCLEDLGIYCVYPALDIFGLPENITAYSTFMKSGADGSGAAVLGYDTMQVNLTYSKLGQSHLGSQFFGDLGTVTVKSISQLTEMDVIYNDGTTRNIIGDVVKEQLMAYEAGRFYELITDKDNENNISFYEQLNERALQVSRVMEEIRNKAGIEFPYSPLNEEEKL